MGVSYPPTPRIYATGDDEARGEEKTGDVENAKLIIFNVPICIMTEYFCEDFLVWMGD